MLFNGVEYNDFITLKRSRSDVISMGTQPHDSRATRRAFVASIGGAGIASISGCIGGGAPRRTTTQTESADSIVVLSGAGLRKPIEEVGSRFESEKGISVDFNFAGADTLLSQIDLNQVGDVYVPGARMYIKEAKEKGYVDDWEIIAYHTPVIGVQEGNPKNVQGLGDLTNSDLDIALGDPGACAIGVLAEKILKGADLYQSVEENVAARGGTVNELVVYLTQQQVDATIIWQEKLHGLHDKIDIIEIPPEDNIVKKIPTGTLTYTDKPTAADEFVDFVASDRGRGVFNEYDFEVYTGES